MSIQDRVVLITGSASGMGKQTARRMAENGATVVLNDIDEERLSGAVGEFQALGLQVSGFPGDISNGESVRQLVEHVTDRFGRIDVLVNNAGMEKAGPLRKLSESDWDVTIDVNLKGVFLCAQAAHSSMVEKKHGRIINIASRAWLGGPGQTPYSSAKAGVVGLTRALALELGKYGITTNCIAPGLIHTPMWDALPDKDKNYLLSKQPSRRLGDADDVASAVMFMADDAAGFINGQVLYVCGGRSLFSG